MEVIIKNLHKKVPVNPIRIKKAVLAILSSEGITQAGEITVCFVNNKQIKELNLMYLGEVGPTDVLTFDNSIKKGKILADIVVSTDAAILNAKIFKTTPLDEIYLYVIHGLLHLLGYDDKNTRQRRIMQGRANQILKTIIRNP